MSVLRFMPIGSVMPMGLEKCLNKLYVDLLLSCHQLSHFYTFKVHNNQCVAQRHFVIFPKNCVSTRRQSLNV